MINAWHAHYVWDLTTIQTDFADGGDGTTYKIIWSQEMIQELKSLNLDLIWTTTWRQHAARSIAPLIGYGHDAPYLTNSEQVSPYEPSITWKVQEVINHQQENPSKLVWIDDEIDLPQMNAVKNLGGLLIPTDPNWGITPKHINQIKEYLQ